MNKTILIICAHPDDEVIGCGGTIAKLSKSGFKINVLFLADGESSRDGFNNKSNLIEKRKKNSIKALKVLGCNAINFLDYQDNRLDSIELLEIVKSVEKYITLYRPSIIFTHYINDLNIDHQITSKAVITACRPQPNYPVKELLFFETCSSTEWNLSESFMPNYFIDISKTLTLKKRALNCYKDEMRPYPHPRSIKSIENLSYYRGSTVGCNAAEAFIIGRKID